MHDIEKQIIIKEKVLRQKARALWVESGDSNTRYFHAQWKIRTSHNSITSIYVKAGVKLTEPFQVEHEFIFVFTGLMGTYAMEFPSLNTEVVKIVYV